MILHNKEIKIITPIAASFDGLEFEPYINLVEEKLFNSLLNWDFYQALQADINPLWTTAQPYENGKEYLQGDAVIYDGVLWCADDDTCNPPPCGWTQKCRFLNPCNCDIWNLYLRYIVSNNVVAYALPFITVRVTPKGIGHAYSDEFDNLGFSEMSTLIKQLNEINSMLYNNMIRYVWRDKRDCFEDLKKCLPCPPDCLPCGGNIDTPNTVPKLGFNIGLNIKNTQHNEGKHM